MARKTVYLVRHGETNGNRHCRHQARSTPLNTRGEKQARALVRALAVQEPDLIITSGARRTQQTALPLLEIIACPSINDPLFEELRRPASAVGASYFNPAAFWAVTRVYFDALHGRTHSFDEETISEFRNRAHDAAARLESEKAEKIVVFSHRVFLSALLTTLLSPERENLVRFLLAVFRHGRIANGSITELHYDSARLVPWRAVRVNDTRHLRGI